MSTVGWKRNPSVPRADDCAVAGGSKENIAVSAAANDATNRLIKTPQLKEVRMVFTMSAHDAPDDLLIVIAARKRCAS